MNLRYLVPALGLLAATATPAFAETIGGLTFSGLVDTGFTTSNTEDDGSDADNSFWAATEIRLAFGVGDSVTTQVDLEWNNGTPASDTDDDGFLDTTNRDVYLEQAYINWAITDTFSITSGKYTTYNGWVAADADGLYRVNAGPVVSGYGGELLGFAFNFTPSEVVAVSAFLVNGLDWWTDTSVGNDNGDLAVAVDVVFTIADIGSINVEGGYDYLTADASHIQFGVNATINPASVEALTIGFELLMNTVTDDSEGGADLGMGDEFSSTWLGGLLMVNYVLPGTPVPMSVTGMIQYVNESGETAAGDLDEETSLEFSLALLTNPTNDANFGLNFEIGMQTDSVDAASGTDPDDVNSSWGSIELLALIP